MLVNFLHLNTVQFALILYKDAGFYMQQMLQLYISIVKGIKLEKKKKNIFIFETYQGNISFGDNDFVC